jgi:hypothetical protein
VRNVRTSFTRDFLFLPLISTPGAGHDEYLYWALANVVVAIVITRTKGAATPTGRKGQQ